MTPAVPLFQAIANSPEGLTATDAFCWSPEDHEFTWNAAPMKAPVALIRREKIPN